MGTIKVVITKNQFVALNPERHGNYGALNVDPPTLCLVCAGKCNKFAVFCSSHVKEWGRVINNLDDPFGITRNDVCSWAIQHPEYNGRWPKGWVTRAPCGVCDLYATEGDYLCPLCREACRTRQEAIS